MVRKISKQGRQKNRSINLLKTNTSSCAAWVTISEAFLHSRLFDGHAAIGAKVWIITMTKHIPVNILHLHPYLHWSCPCRAWFCLQLGCFHLYVILPGPFVEICFHRFVAIWRSPTSHIFTDIFGWRRVKYVRDARSHLDRDCRLCRSDVHIRLQHRRGIVCTAVQ